MDILKPIIALVVIWGIFYFVNHKDKIILYGGVGAGLLVIGYVIYKIIKSRKKYSAWNLDDDKTLFMLKGMSPAQFEQEVADMFARLGYEARVVGGANDGGIDVVANKEGKKYFIQCKKFITHEVTPHDIRDFLGAVTNVNNPAEKGFFITTGSFTLMAEKAAEGNPRIEIIDGVKLVEYYKLSHSANNK